MGAHSPSFPREVLGEAREILKLVRWRYFLILPVATVLLMATVWLPEGNVVGNKKLQEVGAIVLAGAMFLAFVARWARTRAPFATILVVIASAFLMREIHFDGSDIIMMVLLAGCAVWTWLWRERCRESLRDPQLMTWLVLAVATYVYSQFCARRGFKFIPGERTFHEALEEGSENLGHIMMIVAAFVGSWKRGGS